MEECLFCKIIAGEIPATKVYEDADVLAFLDISQVTKGHTLLVPKTHSRNLLALSASESAALWAKVPALANQLIKNLSADGLNILQNNETAAGQSVFHTHIHLIPRYAGDGNVFEKLDADTNLAKIAAQITGGAE
ncbi:MAG: HIT family protein [Streptococcaceae bacterium]|jgi:histidine triad (HIT) family protein|nr:HIT family protein [Streptococcaceae bacterium]